MRFRHQRNRRLESNQNAGGKCIIYEADDVLERESSPRRPDRTGAIVFCFWLFPRSPVVSPGADWRRLYRGQDWWPFASRCQLIYSDGRTINRTSLWLASAQLNFCCWFSPLWTRRRGGQHRTRCGATSSSKRLSNLILFPLKCSIYADRPPARRLDALGCGHASAS